MMLEQEIEKYLSGQTLCNCDSVSYRNIKNLIFGFAEPREKRITELVNENAELKLFKQDCIRLTEDNVVMARQRAETARQLTKAKFLLKQLVDLSSSSRSLLGDTWFDTLREAEQFLKDCEVEK